MIKLKRVRAIVLVLILVISLFLTSFFVPFKDYINL
jgi:hypothetical protein